MKQFKHFITEVSGLQYVYDNVKVCSSLGKGLLLHQLPCTKPELLREEFDKTERHIRFLQQYPDAVRNLVGALHTLNDIRQTILNLRYLRVLDDIELYEIKKFALNSQYILRLMQESEYEDLHLHDLSKVVQTLDPEGSRIAHFYIYSVYDEELAELRKQIQNTEDVEQREELTYKALQIEDKVRQKLTEILHPYWKSIEENLHRIAELDLLNAKAQMAVEWNLCRPVISETKTSYKGLFQPEVKHLLEERGETFQPVNLELRPEPCLITGANMSGKTVVLKSLCLAQHLFQFGFFVPAEAAEIMLMDEVFCIIEDAQSEKHGLSSFAVEVLNINRIIESAKSGRRVLALVDELARTTNPEEGKRIVNAFVLMMQKYGVMSVITTHYGGVAAKCRRLRVNGLRVDQVTDGITPGNLSRYMDYTLVETTSDEVPEEALRIAEIFHADQEFLKLAKEGNQ